MKYHRSEPMVWLTEARLERLNHIRERAGKPLLTAEEAITLLMAMEPRALCVAMEHLKQ